MLRWVPEIKRVRVEIEEVGEESISERFCRL